MTVENETCRTGTQWERARVAKMYLMSGNGVGNITRHKRWLEV